MKEKNQKKEEQNNKPKRAPHAQGAPRMRGEGVQNIFLEDEMQKSYLDYAMSVIVARALPDVRDGLKPVHRRILYAMWHLGLRANVKFRKSAMVVGEVLGKFHPHGDVAVYDSLVRMAQTFSMRYPLIAGQGNFGSIDGDSAAAMRYCVTGDTLVSTNKGMIPIEEISNKEEEKIDLKVINYKGKIVRANKFFNSGKHKIIKITTMQGYELKGSYNHPILCWGLNEFGFPTLRWKILKDITFNDYAIINRNFSLFGNNGTDLISFYPDNSRYKNIGLPKEMDRSLSFLLGALVSEGSFSRGQIAFNNKDLEFYNKVKNILESHFSSIKLYERKIKGNCWELSIYHQRVVKFLENIGLTNVKSDKKEIPFTILSSNKKVVQQFLIALFEGDGSVGFHKDKRHGGKHIELLYNSKSYKLIQQLKILLLSFGIITTSPFKDKRNDCYKLIISGHENIKKFRENIGFFSQRKQKILSKISEVNSWRMSKIDHIPFLSSYLRANYEEEFIQKNNLDRYNKLEKNYPRLKNSIRHQDIKLIEWLLSKKFFFDKIKTIKRLDTEDTVYSLRVDSPCHSFVANGFINHNTETKMAKISEEMLYDIEKNVVDFMPNYGGTITEPKVLPSKIPNLLLNGSLGIAVGMATNIPPHNLTELCNGLLYLIDNEDAEVEDLMKYIKGPDFPTGGLIFNPKNIQEVYAHGKGPIVMRAKTEIIENDSGIAQIVITEIPYQVNKARLLERIAELVKEKKFDEIKDARDESDRDGMRIVLDIKKNAMPQQVLNRLFDLTDLQTTFHVNLVALRDGIEPHTFNLKTVLSEFIAYRRIVIRKRAIFDLERTRERIHILEGLKTALDYIDEIIKLIKKSRDKEEAKVNLMKKYRLTDIQANAILEMRLHQLANLERIKIEDELKEKKLLEKELEEIVKNTKKISEIVKKETKDIIEKYGDERRTRIVSGDAEVFAREDLIPDVPSLIVITADGYLKRVSPDAFKRQERGGKGVIGVAVKEEDAVRHIAYATTHTNLLFFTSSGKVFQLKAYEIPESSRTAKGQFLANFLNVGTDEKILALLTLNKNDMKYLVLATAHGVIKKSAIEDFTNVRKSGIIAIKLKNGDALIGVELTRGDQELFCATSNGQAIRFKEKQLRAMGRAATGVRGIRLKKADAVISLGVVDPKNKNEEVLTITENGCGKRTPIKEYRIQGRGGSGIKTARVTEKTGKIINSFIIGENKEIDLLIMSLLGQIIRISLESISVLGRSTQGVRIMRFKEEKDKVASVALLR